MLESVFEPISQHSPSWTILQEQPKLSHNFQINNTNGVADIILIHMTDQHLIAIQVLFISIIELFKQSLFLFQEA